DDDKDEEEASEEAEDKEEEEHLALADYTTLPAVDPVPSAEDTYAFETDESAPIPPSPRLCRARISIPSPPLPLLSPPIHTSPTYAEEPLGYRAIMTQWRAASPFTHHPSEIPLPPLLLPYTTRRDDLTEADMPLQKRARFTAPTGRFDVGESSSAAFARQTGHTLAKRVDYGFINTVDASIRASESRAITAVGEVNERVTDLATTQRQETHELLVCCEDAQDDRALLRAQVSLLTRERRYFRSMASSYKREAADACRAWAHSESRSQSIEAQIRALKRDVDKMPPKRTTATTTTPMTDATIKALIAQGVADDLAEYAAIR
ncbi:hypothetical protein Tco_0471287, partial [Tanacetum coccineum]